MPTKTLCIRINDTDYKFLAALAHEEREDVSKTVRELVDQGRVMLAIDKYRRSEAAIEKAARSAGVPIARMFDIFREYGIEANLEYNDYLSSLKTARALL